MAIIIPLAFSSSTTAIVNPSPAHRFLASSRPRPRPRTANYYIANIHGFVICCSSSSSVEESTSISVVSSNRQSYETRKWNLDELLKHLDREPAPGDSNPGKMELKEFEMVAEYGTVPAALWHSFTKRLCNSGNYVAATKVLNWVRKHNLCYSYELMYSIIIHGFSKAGRLYEAFLLADELREQGKPLGALTYNALLGACSRNDEYEKALNLLSRMRQEGLQPDIVNYSLVIQALTRANADSCVVINLYEDMKSEGFELDAKLFNDLIYACSKAGDASQAMFFVSKMQARGLNPTMSTYTHLISGLGQSGRINEAEAIFEEMKGHGFVPKVKTYNALLKGYLKAGHFVEAEGIVSEMERNGVMPNEITYSLLIDAYTTAGRAENVRMLFEKMVMAKLKPTCFIYSRLLATFRDRGEWQKAYTILKEMRRTGISPDRHFYNIIIDTFGKHNRLEHAVKAFETMIAEGIQPNNITWNAMIDSHCRAGKHERAMEIFERMQEQGCAPRALTYNILLKSLGEQRKWDDITTTLRKMRSDGLLPNNVTYTTLVDIYSQAGRFHDAVEILEVMKAEGLKPSSSVYCALANAYAQQGMCEQAVNAFKVMETEGIEPNLLMLNLLINAFGVAKRHLEAFSVFEYMKRRGVRPDVVTYTTLMKALIKARKFDRAWDETSISLSAGCDLFTRYVTRTSALEYEDFSAGKSRLIERGERFGEISFKARKTIAMLGQDFLQDGSTILVHGFSRVVLALLRMAASNGKHFSVVCTEGRPDNRGIDMSKELVAVGVPIKLILDSAVAYTMEKIDMVLFGADGVVESGGIINKIGTYQVALVAHSMNKPVYVAAESYKFARLYPLDQRDMPPVPCKNINFEVPVPKSVEVESSARDYTPPQYLTLLFTDLGVLTPSAVSDELIQLYL